MGPQKAPRPRWPGGTSSGLAEEEPGAKAKSQPLRRGVEPCPERGLFCHALGPNWGVGGHTERGKEEEKGTRKGASRAH